MKTKYSLLFVLSTAALSIVYGAVTAVARGTSNLTRGPYLQSQSPQSIIIKWQTTAAVNSRVNWGTQLGNLSNQADDLSVGFEHEIQLTGLAPQSKVYYSVGTTAEVFAGNTEDFHFIMPPQLGQSQATRIWVVGDSGTANTDALAVKNAYLQFNQDKPTHLWMMLGDNAYNTGTQSQYSAAVFDTYPELLKSSTLWPTIGNHDSSNANSITQTGVYYSVFSLPTAANTEGISTGADSGTEAYYSFDFANIHFIVLESNETNSSFRTGMLTWLVNDLQVSSSDWRIAIWHHPPYTKGSHNSDTENNLIYMRENVLEILESSGVDLILTGHSHSYERSWLIDGHYGHSDTFNNITHIISGGEGNANTGSYNKTILGQDSHKGAVYVVAGSSGKISGNQGEAHEAMRNSFALSVLGSLVIDVNKHVLDVTFLNSTAVIEDSFRITKGDVVFINGFE